MSYSSKYNLSHIILLKSLIVTKNTERILKMLYFMARWQETNSSRCILHHSINFTKRLNVVKIKLS